MAKWSGYIGYAETIETSPGIWEEKITERKYVGDVLQATRKAQPSGQVLDDLEVTTRISILADPFTQQNFYAMRYLTFMGATWKISSVEPNYPRLILSVGGLYNGPKAETSNGDE